MTINKPFKVAIIVASVIILLGLFHGCQTSIKGVVVDSETGQPMEGAIVLVEWTKEIGIGDYHTASMRIVETVTNRAGKFNVFGPTHPFVDSPDVTIYKKGYVAWNNKYIFPQITRRQPSDALYSRILMEPYKANYSYDKHVDFIRGAINSAIASNKKKLMREKFAWEIDMALKERQ